MTRLAQATVALGGMMAAAGCTSLLGITGDYTAETEAGTAHDATADVGAVPEAGPSVDAEAAPPADAGSHDAGSGFPDAPGPVAEVTAGRFHSCLRFLSGYAMCWGRDDDYGELGNGTMVSTSVAGPAMGSGIQHLVAGAHDTCALLADGASCAGKGGLGELLDGVGDADSPVPVPVSVLPASPIAIASGDSFTCAVVQGGDVYCAGSGASGALGNGSTADSLDAVQVALPQGKKATAIAAFNLHACALLADGTVACWGDDSFGQLGNDETTPDAGSATPVVVQGLSNATAVCVGDAFSCAIVGSDATSTVWCWGDNGEGQLGNGDPQTSGSAVPVQVKGLTGAASLSCGSGHACIGDEYASPGIWCWGAGGSGQLGDDDTSNAFAPVQVSGISAFPESLAAGGFHTCAMLSSPNVLCWGSNDFGQLGNDSPDASYTPVTVVGVP